MPVTIKIGDRFRRIGRAYKAKTYSVAAVFESSGQQLHARLVNDLLPYEMVTISVPTLNDRRFWERLSA